MRGTVEEALGLVYDMREEHRVFCSLITYPGVPQGMMLLRMIPTAAHSTEDVNITLDAFSAVGEKLRNGEYGGSIPNLRMHGG